MTAMSATTKGYLAEGGGVLAGAVAGFFIAGPLGALAGAAVGFGVGDALKTAGGATFAASATNTSPPQLEILPNGTKIPAGLTGLQRSDAIIAALPVTVIHNDPVTGKKKMTFSLSGGHVAGESDVPPCNSSQVGHVAMKMNEALQQNGYKKADMPLYMAFQHVAGLPKTGYPDDNTMHALAACLTPCGVPMAQLPLYPWHPGRAYDGQNAPSAEEWLGNAKWRGHSLPISAVDAKGKPTGSQVVAMIPLPKTAHISSVQDLQRALNQTGFARPPLHADGSGDAATVRAIQAYQKAHGIPVTGMMDQHLVSSLESTLRA